MNRPSERKIITVDDWAEYEALGHTVVECTAFLHKYRAHKPLQSDAEPDAVVAIVELKRESIERRRKILFALRQTDIPF